VAGSLVIYAKSGEQPQREDEIWQRWPRSRY
jgi:hypothetical protein